jgi:hypothetical protein
MACLAQSGSALFPFLVGSLAHVYGIKVLQRVHIALFVAMILVWQPVPLLEVALRRSSIVTKPASIGEIVESVATNAPL